ncbi:MAG: HEAT repeat domain-containing protein, partial [Planctomycetota bacterium]
MRLRVGSPSGARAGSPAGIGPFIAALVLGLALVFTADLGAQIRPDLERLLDEGLSLAQQDRLDEASKVFEKALLLDPTSEEALEWVERVGLHHLFKVIRSGSDSLASQMGTLIRLTTIETKRRSSEPERIAEVLQEYFMTDDVMKKYKLLMTSVSEHGVYLIPGIVERLGEPEQDLRVRAIRALTRISDDAVMPLTRVLHHPDPRVVLGAIASLQKIKNPAAVPSLKWVAESSDDMIIRQAALDVARAIAPRISEESAYGLLQMQAKRFYSDSGYMSRTYHDAVIWELKDGALSFRNVHSWA